MLPLENEFLGHVCMYVWAGEEGRSSLRGADSKMLMKRNTKSAVERVVGTRNYVTSIS